MARTLKEDYQPVVHYIADGIVKEFYYNYLTFESDDVDVYIGEILQMDGYQVVLGTDGGGKVIFAVAPAKDKTVTIIRNLEIKRTSNFQENGALRAKVINHELDYQVASIQQLEEKIGRTVVFPPYLASNVNVTLPTPEAGRALVWNQNSNSFENSKVAINTAFIEIDASVKEAQASAALASEEHLKAMDKAVEAKDSADTSKIWADKSQAEAGFFYVPMVCKKASELESVYRPDWKENSDVFLLLDTNLDIIFEETATIKYPEDVTTRAYIKRLLIQTTDELFMFNFSGDGVMITPYFLNGNFPELTEFSVYECIISLVPTEDSYVPGLENMASVLVSMAKYY